ncbi:MAG TPA: Fic family protein [Candidatus Eisenbacteria bacterium]|nr:Fic family protein [Candidatus Eisenbacteria bacterium]
MTADPNDAGVGQGEAKIVSDRDLAAADAQYAGFPGFDVWSKLGVEAQIWTDALNRSLAVREAATPEAYQRAMATTMRLAAVDTGAIEGLYAVDRGFTFSVAEQTAAWEAEMDKRGTEVRALFESQLRAYELVLDAATTTTPISEAFLRQVHEEATSAQETYTVYTPLGRQQRPLPRGVYKDFPNHPWGTDGLRHAYAPVRSTPPEMHRLVTEINSSAFEAAHPIHQASYVHYALVQIHPFADGNGRASRAAASIFLYRAASVPFLLFADQKPGYIDALEAADRGDYQAFADYVGERGTSAVNRFTEILRAGLAPSLDDSLAALRNLHVAVGSLTYAELDGRVSAINAIISTGATDQLAALSLPGTFKTRVINVRAADVSSSSFRPAIAGDNVGTRFTVTSAAPAEAAVAREILIRVARDRNPRRTYEIATSSGDAIQLALADVYPDVSLDATYRLQNLVRASIAEAMDELSRLAADNLRSRGF